MNISGVASVESPNANWKEISLVSNWDSLNRSSGCDRTEWKKKTVAAELKIIWSSMNMAIFHPAVQYLQVILELLTNISPSYIPYILSHAHFQRVWEFALLFAKPLTNYCYCLNVRDFLFSNPIDNFLSIIFDLSICWNNGLIHTQKKHTHSQYVYSIDGYRQRMQRSARKSTKWVNPMLLSHYENRKFSGAIVHIFCMYSINFLNNFASNQKSIFFLDSLLQIIKLLQ